MKQKYTKPTWPRDCEVSRFSVYKVAEGGPGYGLIEQLHAEGIPARKSYTIYVGHVGIEVPKRFYERAEKIVFP